MFKDVARSLDLGMLPQIALVAFVLAFLCVLAYAFWLPRATRRAYAALPLDDDDDTPAAAPDAAAPDDRDDGTPLPNVLSTPR